MIRRRLVPVAAGPLLALVVALTAGAAAPAAGAPRITISSPAPGWTSLRAVRIAGRVESGDPALSARLVFNGVPQILALAEGAFEVDAVLAPGANEARVVAWDGNGTSVASVWVHSTSPPNQVRVIVTWDAPDADVDLAVTDPSGERCDQDRPATAGGGQLDLDVSDGSGPETFTLPRTIAGRLKVELSLFASRGPRPVRCRVDVVLREGGIREERRTYRATLARVGETTVVAVVEIDGED